MFLLLQRWLSLAEIGWLIAASLPVGWADRLCRTASIQPPTGMPGPGALGIMVEEVFGVRAQIRRTCGSPEGFGAPHRREIGV